MATNIASTHEMGVCVALGNFKRKVPIIMTIKNENAKIRPGFNVKKKPFSFLEIKTLLDRILGEPGTAERA